MYAKLELAAATAAFMMAATGASSACAAIKIIDFTINGVWRGGGSATPYGLPALPTLAGALTIDDTTFGGDTFVGLDFTTGSRTWKINEVNRSESRIFRQGGDIGGFMLWLPGINISTHLTVTGPRGAIISEGLNYLSCDNCVRVDSVRDGVAAVPEPAAWALAVIGFGAAGVALRRRRTNLSPSF